MAKSQPGSIIVDGKAVSATPLVNDPNNAGCSGAGWCAVITNMSAADTLYVSADKSSLERAKANGNNNFGTPIAPGATLVIPWVSTPMWAMNYVNASTPLDILNVEAWA